MDLSPAGQEAAAGAARAASDLVAEHGEGRESLLGIGEILEQFGASGALDPLIDGFDGSIPAVVHRLATPSDGSRLALFVMDGWRSPAQAPAFSPSTPKGTARSCRSIPGLT